MKKITLEEEYELVASEAIGKGIITEDEWEEKFKYYKDGLEHSFVDYLVCILEGIEIFLTNSQILIENKEEFEERFGVKIVTTEEFTNDI